MFLPEKALSLTEMEISFTQVCGKTENVMGLVQNITKKEKLFLQENGKTINIWTVFCIKK